MAKRRLYAEMMEGVATVGAHREGKVTLRSYKIEAARLAKVNAKAVREIRERFNFSRPVFARKLHVNERTLEKWEQGRAKPNPQAVTLLLLVRSYPDTLDRLEELAAR